jgi:hypothetical protein
VFPVQLRDQPIGFVRGEPAEDGIQFGFLPIIAFLRLRGAEVEKIGESGDLLDELEELGLPVGLHARAQGASINSTVIPKECSRGTEVSGRLAPVSASVLGPD